jgi:hypothetical protein
MMEQSTTEARKTETSEVLPDLEDERGWRLRALQVRGLS